MILYTLYPYPVYNNISWWDVILLHAWSVSSATRHGHTGSHGTSAPVTSPKCRFSFRLAWITKNWEEQEQWYRIKYIYIYAYKQLVHVII